jgi:nanoRNase/pAp phosphatase (c-di-AMP/oligoRNAs hydrolase)
MDKLTKILDKEKHSSIIVHNNPDPDSLASAMALMYLLKKLGYRKVRIYYDGLVGRAENQAMIRILKIPLSMTKNMSSITDASASKVLKKIIPPYGTAGGHDMSAGAQLRIDRRKKQSVMSVKNEIIRKILKELNHQPVDSLFWLVDNQEFSL